MRKILCIMIIGGCIVDKMLGNWDDPLTVGTLDAAMIFIAMLFLSVKTKEEL